MKRIQAFSLLLATLVVAGPSLAQPADPAGAIEPPGEAEGEAGERQTGGELLAPSILNESLL